MTTPALIPAELLPHQQRVVDELGQLIEKIEKLSVFLSSRKFADDLGSVEQHLLKGQLHAMNLYADALNGQLEHWGVVK